MTDKNIANLLKFDGIDAAEKITGKSYKESEATKLLGVGLHIEHSKFVNAALDATGDSKFSNELIDYQKIILSIGFELALEIPFNACSYMSKSRDEKLFVYVNREKGILLTFDTFEGVHVNSGDFYYCWKPTMPSDKLHRVTSSGGFESEKNPNWRRDPEFIGKKPDDFFWFGHHDCRQAIKHHISELEANGNFMPQWPSTLKKESMRTFFMHYQDWREPEYENKPWGEKEIYLTKLFKERSTMVPDWLKKMIGWDCTES